ncbi:MAG: hypothetical protein M3417_15090 [Actinomycetota bacterium]|nr:hypothetical protein [Actinomycetota bacterium]
MRRHLAVVAVCLGAWAVVPTAQAATTRSCGSVSDPYPGTRYEGVDLSRITATGVSCRTAKRVARGAHRRALGLTPLPSGMRSFSWDGWRITGDLRGSSDRYVATKGAKRVRWRF